MKFTLQSAKEFLLKAIDAIEEEETVCAIQVKEESLPIFKKALQDFQVQALVKKKKVEVKLIVLNVEQLQLMFDFRTLGVALLKATDLLRESTGAPRKVWLSHLVNEAMGLVSENGDETALMMHELEEVGISEAGLVSFVEGELKQRINDD